MNRLLAKLRRRSEILFINLRNFRKATEFFKRPDMSQERALYSYIREAEIINRREYCIWTTMFIKSLKN